MTRDRNICWNQVRMSINKCLTEDGHSCLHMTDAVCSIIFTCKFSSLKVKAHMCRLVSWYFRVRVFSTIGNYNNTAETREISQLRMCADNSFICFHNTFLQMEGRWPTTLTLTKLLKSIRCAFDNCLVGKTNTFGIIAGKHGMALILRSAGSQTSSTDKRLVSNQANGTWMSTANRRYALYIHKGNRPAAAALVGVEYLDKIFTLEMIWKSMAAVWVQ